MNLIKHLILVFMVLILANIALAGLPVHLKPQVDGNIQPNTQFDYQFDFTSDSGCSNVLLSQSYSNSTDIYGEMYVEIDISELNATPSYLCEYRNGELRKVHSLSNGLFSEVRVSGNYYGNASEMTDYSWSNLAFVPANAVYDDVSVNDTHSQDNSSLWANFNSYFSFSGLLSQLMNDLGFIGFYDYPFVLLNDTILNDTYLAIADFTTGNDAAYDADNIAFINDTLLNSTYLRHGENLTDGIGNDAAYDGENIAFLNESLLNATYLRYGENLTDGTGNDDAYNPDGLVFSNESLLNGTYLRHGENATYDDTSVNATINNLDLAKYDGTNVCMLNESLLNDTYQREAFSDTSLNVTHNADNSTLTSMINNIGTGNDVAYNPSDIAFLNESELNATYLRYGENVSDGIGNDVAYNPDNIAFLNESQIFAQYNNFSKDVRFDEGINLTRYATCTLKTDGNGELVCGTDNTGVGGNYDAYNPDSLAFLNESVLNATYLRYGENVSDGIGNDEAYNPVNLAFTNISNTFSVDNIFSTSIRINATGCDSIDTDANGLLYCGSDATGAGGGMSIGDYPFMLANDTAWNATYTRLNDANLYYGLNNFTKGIMVNISSCDSLDTTVDGEVVCGTDAQGVGGSVDFTNVTMHQIFSRRSGYYTQITNTAIVFVAYGMTLPTVVGTASAITNNSMQTLKFVSAATNNTLGGQTGAYTLTQTNFNPKYSASVGVDVVSASVIWVGLADSALTTLSPSMTNKSSAVDFVAVSSQPEINDHKWACCAGDGTTYGCNDMGVLVQNNTKYTIVVDWTNRDSLVCTVISAANGVTTYAKTTNLNTRTSIALGIHNGMTTLLAASTPYYISKGMLEQN